MLDAEGERLFNKFNNFSSQTRGESDRGCALICAAVLDDLLQDLFVTVFDDVPERKLLFSGANGPLSSFYAKLLLARSMGFIDAHSFSEINKIRKIRNEFAHILAETNFNTQKIHDICSSFSIEMMTKDENGEPDLERSKKDHYGSPRQALVSTTVVYAFHFIRLATKIRRGRGETTMDFEY